MGLVITISGLHGTGKSTYAKALSEAFGLRHASAGELFRQVALERGMSLKTLSEAAEMREEFDKLVDGRTKLEASKGSVIIDGLLAGWMARDYADIKIFLAAPERTRVERVAKREGQPFEEALRATRHREGVERRRFKKFYVVDMDDVSIYDLVINTALLPLNSNIEVLKTFVREYISTHKGGR